MWPFKKIRINTRDRREREISLLGITVIQYGHKETNGIKETYLEILPKSFEHKTLDKIISFLPKDDTYDHVWIVRTVGLGEAQLLNFMMEELTKKWNVKSPCFVSHRAIYKQMFALYSDIPFYRILMKHSEYAPCLTRRDIRYKRKVFHVHHCTIEESKDIVRRWNSGEKSHAIDVYKKWSGIARYSYVQQVVPADVADRALKKVQEIDLNIDKFIFLAPEAQATQEIEEKVWMEIIAKARNFGYDIFVNTAKGRSLYGKSVYLGVDEAMYIASRAKKIITLRCGFAELLAAIPNRGDLYILYSHVFGGVSSESFFQIFSLKKYPFYNSQNTFELSIGENVIFDQLDKLFN